MNKDVIYIEPEDDITDIITKIEKSKEKIIALVPPKKAGVFRSVVNIKLIAKSGASVEKTVVLVTTDPSIVKLAAATKLPVTKDLQSAPVIPKMDTEIDSASEEVIEEPEDELDEPDEPEEPEDETNKGSSKDAEAAKKAKKATAEETEVEPDEASEAEAETKDEEDEKPKAAKTKKSAKHKNKFIAWIADHKKIAIAGGIGIIAVILILIWALAIAPAVTVTVGIRTTTNNFSENVTFVSKTTDEKAEEGKFYLEERKVESVQETSFEATGKKNVGQKASGEVIVYTYIDDGGGTVAVNAGDIFTNNNLNFVADNGVKFSYDGKDTSVCDNANVSVSEFKMKGCLVSGKIKVTAAEPGVAYNIAATDNGWNTTARVAVYSNQPMVGGTDDLVTIVQQSDVEKAKEALASADESGNKEKLFENINDDTLVIDSSYKQTTSDAISSPAVGEEAKDGKATLKANTVASVYVLDKTKVEKFITDKANLKDDQKIYEMKDPFIENFTKTDSGYAGKMKTSYATGPRMSESEMADMIKGRGLGDAQHLLRDVDGVNSVTIDTSYPWVTAIPGNTNKITVIFDIKE